MVNTKSLMLLLSVASLGLAALGLVRFGVDCWSYLRADGVANQHLDFGGLWAAFSCVLISSAFFLVYRKLRD